MGEQSLPRRRGDSLRPGSASLSTTASGRLSQLLSTAVDFAAVLGPRHMLSVGALLFELGLSALLGGVPSASSLLFELARRVWVVELLSTLLSERVLSVTTLSTKLCSV